MSELAVNKALKVVIETSIIPELENKIKKLQKYKTLFKRAKDVLQKIDGWDDPGKIPSDYDIVICYDCIKELSYNVSERCWECNDCVSKVCVINPCKNCNFVCHIKCYKINARCRC